MVFVRYILNHNTIWQTDFVTWSLVAATFIGSPYLLLSRGHVNVDVLPQYFHGRKRWWLPFLSIAMSLAFCLFVTVLAPHFWLPAWENPCLSNPTSPPPSSLPNTPLPLQL